MTKTFIVCIFSSLLLADEYSIQEAYEHLLQVNETLQSKKLATVRSHKIKEASKSLNLPTISLNASYTKLDKPIEMNVELSALPIPLPDMHIPIAKEDIFLANANMQWVLYSGGKISSAQHLRELQAKEQQEHYNLSEDALFLELVELYYGYQLAKSVEQMRLDVKNSLEKHFDNATKLKNQAQIAYVELLNAKVKLQEANIEYTKAHHKTKLAQSALFSLLHVSTMIPRSPLFIIEHLETENHFRENVLSTHSGLKILEYKHDEAKALTEIEKSAFKPKLLAYANYTLYKDDSLLSELTPNWFAGALLHIDLLDSSGRDEKLEASKLLSQELTLLHQQTSRKLTLLTQKLYLELELYIEEFTSLNDSIALAKENLRVRTLAFEEGLSTSVDVVDAKLFLASIETKKLHAQYNYVKNLAQLLSISGRNAEFFKMASQGQ